MQRPEIYKNLLYIVYENLWIWLLNRHVIESLFFYVFMKSVWEFIILTINSIRFKLIEFNELNKLVSGKIGQILDNCKDWELIWSIM